MHTEIHGDTSSGSAALAAIRRKSQGSERVRSVAPISRVSNFFPVEERRPAAAAEAPTSPA